MFIRQFIQPLNKDFSGICPVYIVEVFGKNLMILFHLSHLFQMLLYPASLGTGKLLGSFKGNAKGDRNSDAMEGPYRNIDVFCPAASLKQGLANALLIQWSRISPMNYLAEIYGVSRI